MSDEQERKHRPDEGPFNHLDDTDTPRDESVYPLNPFTLSPSPGAKQAAGRRPQRYIPPQRRFGIGHPVPYSRSPSVLSQVSHDHDEDGKVHMPPVNPFGRNPLQYARFQALSQHGQNQFITGDLGDRVESYNKDMGVNLADPHFGRFQSNLTPEKIDNTVNYGDINFQFNFSGDSHSFGKNGAITLPTGGGPSTTTPLTPGGHPNAIRSTFGAPIKTASPGVAGIPMITRPSFGDSINTKRPGFSESINTTRPGFGESISATSPARVAIPPAARVRFDESINATRPDLAGRRTISRPGFGENINTTRQGFAGPAMTRLGAAGNHTISRPSHVRNNATSRPSFGGSPNNRPLAGATGTNTLARGLAAARGIRENRSHLGMTRVDSAHGMRLLPPGVILPAEPPTDDPAAWAGYKAKLIMLGLADDPNDPDYGNPGESNTQTAIYKRHAAEKRRGQVSDPSRPDPVDRIPNTRGNAAAYLGTFTIPDPQWLLEAEADPQYTPSFDMVFDSLPFLEACRIPLPSTAGVLRITNLPFLTTKPEVVAFLGRNAKILSQPIGTPYMAVHIMMDRLSGKTLDCFVEVENHKEAEKIYKSFIRRIEQGKGAKLGDRPVVVEVASQQELMAELFPRAKNASWTGPIPNVDTVNREEFYPGVYSAGFVGFFKPEELSHMIKHCEHPTRSPYNNRNFIRAYECIIYTIYKYPWYDVEHVSIFERDELFKVVLRAIVALMGYLREHGGAAARHNPTKPSNATLKELVVCALICPGFNEQQKARIIAQLHGGQFGQYTVSKGMNITFGGTDDYSALWPFRVLVKNPRVSGALVEFVAGIMKEGTMGNNFTMNDLAGPTRFNSPFGTLFIDYTGNVTLADVARTEMRALEALLKATLPEVDSNTATTPTDLGSFLAFRYGQRD